MSKWKPIESAPSGAHVLIFYRNGLGKGRIIKALKCGKFEFEDDSGDQNDFAEYDEARGAYFYPPGWYEAIDNWPDYSNVAVHEGIPTHWQPLPDPPKDAP